VHGMQSVTTMLAWAYLDGGYAHTFYCDLGIRTSLVITIISMCCMLTSQSVTRMTSVKLSTLTY